MPRIDQQRRLYEAGRLRMGVKGPKGFPRSLKHWRLTSQHRGYLDAAAKVYGGDVRGFKDPLSDHHWELLTETDSLDVFVHPQLPLSEWYELWDAAGCNRRCDGATASLMDGQRGDVECVCDPDDRDCLPLTRLSVMLRGVEALGSWRLETKGRNAGAELGGAAQLAQQATAAGWSLPCKLVIEERTRKGRDRTGKPVTRRFVVPVLTLDVVPEVAVQIAAGHTYAPPEVLAGSTTDQMGLPPMRPRELGPPPKRTKRAIEDVIPESDLPFPGDEPGADRYPEAQGHRRRDVGPAQPPAEPPAEPEDDGPPPFGEAASDVDPGAARFQLSLAPSFQGKGEAQRRRHALYSLGMGWGIGFNGLTGQAKNRVVRWSHKIEEGELVLAIEDRSATLYDKATNDVIEHVVSDLKGDGPHAQDS